MNAAALRSDFEQLPKSMQHGILAVLRTCEEHKLACRCEVVGRDIQVIIGRGYSSGKYWLDQYLPKRID
jgi:hypothetical protein